MNFVSTVDFKYDLKKGNIHVGADFSNIENLIYALHKSLYTNSFELVLTRTVTIIDKDSEQKPVVLGNEKLNLIVADALTFSDDIRNFLKQKYNETFGFEKLNLHKNKPVYFSGVMESEELGPINPNTGDNTTYIRRNIECRQLTNSDIVVDKNLHQIWPEKTCKTPKVLIDFLTKTKEIIH